MKRIPAVLLTFVFLALAGYLLGFAPQVINPGGSTLATPVSVANGGTGLASGTSGGVLGYTASGTLASSIALTANLPVIGGGAGATPTVGSRTGNTTQYATWTGATTASRCVHTDASGNLIIAAADCATSLPFVTGTVYCTIGAWSGTTFGPITGSGGTNCGDSGAARASAIPGSYTAKNMYVAVFDASDAAKTICASCTLAVTLVLNGSDQALTCTVGNSSSSCNDTTHTVAVTAGQVLLWRIVASGVFAGTEQDLSIAAQLQ